MANFRWFVLMTREGAFGHFYTKSVTAWFSVVIWLICVTGAVSH